MLNSDRVSLVGLGKLGLPLAACYADAGVEVLGIDINELVVTSVNAGQCPIVEPELAALLAEHGGKGLSASTDYRRAIYETDVTIILVSTPSDGDGSFSNKYIEAALTSLAEVLRDSDKPDHLFVISSTVMPGSILDSFVPLISRISGRRLGEGFRICYDPDFVALGNVIHDFRHPDILVIGESDAIAGEVLEDLHLRICYNHPYIGRMSIPSAEIAKVSLNAYITTKISFANMIANVCERVPGGDVDAVTQTIGHDRRIAPYYFSGGLGFGGNCFPRDTRAFIALARSVGVEPSLIEAVDAINTHQDNLLYQTVLRLTKGIPSPTVGVLGLAFKPKTPVITASPSITLIERLLADNLSVVAYDPLAHDEVQQCLGDDIFLCDTAEECLTRASVVVVCHRTDIYRAVIEAFTPMDPLIIVDPWRLINPQCVDERIRIVPFGKYL